MLTIYDVPQQGSSRGHLGRLCRGVQQYMQAWHSAHRAMPENVHIRSHGGVHACCRSRFGARQGVLVEGCLCAV